MSQKHQILMHLKRKPITAWDALREYGCFRLAARIDELRKAGHKIDTELVERGQKRFAQYRLMA